MALAPTDTSIKIDQLINDPYPIYQRLRAEAPVLRVESINRTLLTKAEDTRAVKDNPALFSSDDPSTPMEKAFEAHTLMRKDGKDHMRERMAMMPTFSSANLKSIWAPAYEKHADAYLNRLQTDETIDLFPTLAGPLSARILAEVLGLPNATDEEMQYWSQALIDGNKCIAVNAERLKADPDQSALSVMVNAEDPIPWSQIVANIKIAIGGGVNEPRDAMLTIIFGLLNNRDQLEELTRTSEWGKAFEEGVRWVAPIQASSRMAVEDTEIRGLEIPKGDVVMTIQASANHDEDLYDAPEVFNAFRSTNRHQSFGSGPHHCMGTHLARLMVGKIMLPMIFERFPNMTLPDTSAVSFQGFGFRGPINLPVRLT